MGQNLLYSGFLYFPEDKTAYIPAVVEFTLIIILCVAVFMLIRRISKKQELKAKKLEEKLLRERNQQTQYRSEH